MGLSPCKMRFKEYLPESTTADDDALLLTNVTPAQYWEAQPYTNATLSDAGYYYSPNARQVFATVPGPVQVTWRKFDAGTTSTNKVTIGGLNYALTNASYVAAVAQVQIVFVLAISRYWFRETIRPLRDSRE